MKRLDEIIEQLPPEVFDFAQFLLKAKTKPKQEKLRMSWAGGLIEFREKFTSIELQKKALEWCID